MLKTKSGYFFLSFALLIVAVITPVELVTSLNDLSVKTSINLYKNRVESFNIGENLVDSKFSRFLSQHPGSNLYGISRFQDEEDDPRLEYKIFSQSSLTPTTSDLGVLRWADDGSIDTMQFRERFRTIVNDGESTRLVDMDNFLREERVGVEADDRLIRAIERDRVPDEERVLEDGELQLINSNFLYTLPALGTGDATDLECVPFDLNSNILRFDRGENFIDPLEHPCNYNKLEFGDVIAIPLFYKDNGEVVNYDFDSPLQISFRTPCSEFQEYCDANDRMGFPRNENLKMAILGSGGDVFQGNQLDLQEDTNLNWRLTNFSKLGLVVNDDLLINEIIARGSEKPLLILQSENNNLDIPYLEYQVRSAKPFSDNKVTMTANIINSGRTYNMDSRQFKPEINVDLGVVFGN